MDTYYNNDDNVFGFKILAIIGEGRYGIAYLAVDSKGNKVVIKQLKEEMLERSRKKVIYEFKTLRAVNNPYIPKVISGFKDKDKEGYILEYIKGDTLYNVVARQHYKFTRDDIYYVCKRLLDIMESLHEKGIAHRDIRLPNVIINDNNEIFLIDFGLARFVDNDRYYKEEDYWYLGDLLLHLYYTSFYEESSLEDSDKVDNPWDEELSLFKEEEIFIKKLMGIEKPYRSISEIKKDLKNIMKINIRRDELCQEKRK